MTVQPKPQKGGRITTTTEPNPKTVVIVLALGDVLDNNGELNEPRDGSINRLFGGIHYLRKNGIEPENALLVCTAGFSKETPTKRHEGGRTFSLSQQLEKYLHEGMHIWNAGKAWGPRFVAANLTWGTRGEICEGIEHVSLFYGNKSFHQTDEVTLVIATNLAHIPRVWLYGTCFCPPKWRLKIVRVDHEFTLWSHILELIKFPIELWSLRKKLRRAMQWKLYGWLNKKLE